MTKLITLVALIAAAFSLERFHEHGRAIWVPAVQQIAGKRTVDQAVTQFGPAAQARLAPHFRKAGVPYPPARVSFIGLKEEKRLELWAQHQGRQVLIRSYEIKRASGKAGPKLREGDEQVPEGLYRIEGLNPNSSYHLSLKLNYPNAFDRQQAQHEGRVRLGGDIFIHGKAVSIGCLAMGDEAIEEIFVLASRVGKDNVAVLLAPRDFRHAAPVPDSRLAPWLNRLYADIHRELGKYRM